MIVECIKILGEFYNPNLGTKYQFKKKKHDFKWPILNPTKTSKQVSNMIQPWVIPKNFNLKPTFFFS